MYEPGSVKTYTPADIRRAWSRRGTDPEGTKTTLMDARHTWRLKDIADAVGESTHTIRPFLTPAIPESEAQLLRSARSGDYHGFGDLPHAPVEQVVATFRAAGWSLQSIGDALGVSRQYVHSRFGTAEHRQRPNQAILDAITPRPELPKYAPIQVPRYAIDPDDPGSYVPSGIVPDKDIDKLAALMDAYRDSREPKDRKKAVDFATEIVDRYKVSYSQLSIAVGPPANRWTLSRMAIREGHILYVPGMETGARPSR